MTPVLSVACASGDHALCRPDRDPCECTDPRCIDTHNPSDAARSAPVSTSPPRVPLTDVERGTAEALTRDHAHVPSSGRPIHRMESPMRESMSVSLRVRPDTVASANKVNHPDLPGCGYVKLGDHPVDVMLTGSLVDIRAVLVAAITAVDTVRMQHYADMAEEVAAG